jgi:phosphoribosylanthranilate isomerase
MTRIKICGVRRPEHAEVAVEAGADFIGLVFYPGSKRYVTVEEARAVQQAVPRDRAALVGLFVNQSVDEITALADACGLDYIQLSGNEPPEFCRGVMQRTGRPVVKMVRGRFSAGLLPANAQAELEQALLKEAARYPEELAPVLLVDAPAHGAWGGTGQSWPYAAARALAAQRRILLAGGLHAGNVAEAIRLAQPWGVDVSSGVETDGVKDPDKIIAFIRAARSVMLGQTQ